MISFLLHSITTLLLLISCNTVGATILGCSTQFDLQSLGARIFPVQLTNLNENLRSHPTPSIRHCNSVTIKSRASSMGGYIPHGFAYRFFSVYVVPDRPECVDAFKFIIFRNGQQKQVRVMLQNLNERDPEDLRKAALSSVPDTVHVDDFPETFTQICLDDGRKTTTPTAHRLTDPFTSMSLGGSDDAATSDDEDSAVLFENQTPSQKIWSALSRYNTERVVSDSTNSDEDSQEELALLDQLRDSNSFVTIHLTYNRRHPSTNPAAMNGQEQQPQPQENAVELLALKSHILAASPYFQAMLHSSEDRGRGSILSESHTHPSVFLAVLEYVHTGEFHGVTNVMVDKDQEGDQEGGNGSSDEWMSDGRVVELIEFAERTYMSDLKRRILDAISEKATAHNAVYIYIALSRLGETPSRSETQLRLRILDMIKREFDGMGRDEKWTVMKLAYYGEYVDADRPVIQDLMVRMLHRDTMFQVFHVLKHMQASEEALRQALEYIVRNRAVVSEKEMRDFVARLSEQHQCLVYRLLGFGTACPPRQARRWYP